MSRLFRQGEPLHPGLPPPRNAFCPFCGEDCDETPQHIFGSCDCFDEVRRPFLEGLKDYDTCRLNGIAPEDPLILQWKRSIPDEYSYPPLPVWVPDPNREFISDDGRRQFGTDGGTDHPRDRKIRFSGCLLIVRSRELLADRNVEGIAG